MLYIQRPKSIQKISDLARLTIYGYALLKNVEYKINDFKKINGNSYGKDFLEVDLIYNVFIELLAVCLRDWTDIIKHGPIATCFLPSKIGQKKRQRRGCLCTFCSYITK